MAVHGDLVAVKDYSQFGEQAVILEHAGDEPGRFLDIGGFDGETFSNTRALAEQGWGGVIYEPVPDLAARCRRLYHDRSDVDVLALAVDVEPGMLQFWTTNDLVSTSDPAHYARWRGFAQYESDPITVPAVSIGMAIRNSAGPFGVVSIDTEGTSARLLFALLAALRGGRRLELPRVVCVEHDDQHEAIILAAGRWYRVAMLNGTNIVLVRKDLV